MKYNDVPPACRGLFKFTLVLLLALGSPAKSSAAVTTNFFDGFENGLNGWLVGDNDVLGTPCYWGVVDAAGDFAGVDRGK